MKKISIKNKWALVCERSSVDVNSNLVSIFQAIDEITINPPQEPLLKLPSDGIAAVFPHEFVAVWKRDTDATDELILKAKVRLFDPSKTILLNENMDMRFEKGKPNLRTFVKFGALKFKASGEYRYEIEVTDEKAEPVKASAEFTIKIKDK